MIQICDFGRHFFFCNRKFLSKFVFFSSEKHWNACHYMNVNQIKRNFNFKIINLLIMYAEIIILCCNTITFCSLYIFHLYRSRIYVCLQPRQMCGSLWFLFFIMINESCFDLLFFIFRVVSLSHNNNSISRVL